MKNPKLQMIAPPREETSCCSCCADGSLEEKSPLWLRHQLIKGTIAGGLLASGLFVESLSVPGVIPLLLFISVIGVSGSEILKKAISSVRARRLDINCLMGLAAFGSFFIGHAEEGAAVIFLFFIAETLEEYSAERARRSIADLLHLAPETAIVKRDGKEVELHTHEIHIGDIIVVRPGEKIPLDGTITSGHSSINEAPITGESVPADKAKGDSVYAGTMNEEGYLEISVTKKSGNTLLARIVKLVEEAERKKSVTETYINRFARYYTPAVICIACGVFLIPVVMGYPWEVWMYRSLVLLVISCPCALAISTPVAMVSAITSASRHGVLIKGAVHIENMSRVRAFAFDKTGTLTKGVLEVTDIKGFNNHSPEEVLSIAASLESRSQHPIAGAVTRKASENNVTLLEVKQFKSHRGRGLEGHLNGTMYYAGARNMFDRLSINIPDDLTHYENEGKTSIFISNPDKVIGVIAMADSIRKNAPHVIAGLRGLNIRTEMLTGDNKKTAQALAEQTGIDGYYASLLPEEKVTVVAKLTERFGHVAMVGDGVNDAPALASADVGIVMGAIGSDVAIESADIALMHDELSRINYLVNLSRSTMRIVKQNVTAAVLIKGSLTIMAIPGMISLWTAVGIGDMGLSLAVILNAMRLTRIKE